MFNKIKSYLINILNSIKPYLITFLLYIILCLFTMYLTVLRFDYYRSHGIQSFLIWDIVVMLLVFSLCLLTAIYLPTNKYISRDTLLWLAWSTIIAFLMIFVTIVIIHFIDGSPIIELFETIKLLVGDIVSIINMTTPVAPTIDMTTPVAPTIDMTTPVAPTIDYKSMSFLDIYKKSDATSSIFKIYRPISAIDQIYNPIIEYHFKASNTPLAPFGIRIPLRVTRPASSENVFSDAIFYLVENTRDALAWIETFKTMGSQGSDPIVLYKNIYSNIESISHCYQNPDTALGREIIRISLNHFLPDTLDFVISDLKNNIQKIQTRISYAAIDVFDLSFKGYGFSPSDYSPKTFLKIFKIKMDHGFNVPRPFGNAYIHLKNDPMFVDELVHIAVHNLQSARHDLTALLLQNGFTMEQIHRCEFAYSSISEFNPVREKLNGVRYYIDVASGREINPNKAMSIYINEVLPDLLKGLVPKRRLGHFILKLNSKYLDSVYHTPLFIDGIPTRYVGWDGFLILTSSTVIVGGLTFLYFTD